jgi:hypothetical protein
MENIAFAADLIRQSKHAVVLTGRGFPHHLGYLIFVLREQAYGQG